MTILIAMNLKQGAFFISDCMGHYDNGYKRQIQKIEPVKLTSNNYMYYASSGLRNEKARNYYFRLNHPDNDAMAKAILGLDNKNQKGMQLANEFAMTTQIYDNSYIFLGIFEGIIKMSIAMQGNLNKKNKLFSACLGNGVTVKLENKLEELSKDAYSEPLDVSLKYAYKHINTLYNLTSQFRGYQILRIDKTSNSVIIKYAEDLNAYNIPNDVMESNSLKQVTQIIMPMKIEPDKIAA